jgi:FlaA1/EpsC-like NDP-sugar epimerase
MSQRVGNASVFRAPIDDGSISLGNGLPRFLLLTAVYAAVIVFARWLAFEIRFEFEPPPEQTGLFWKTLQWALPVQLFFLFIFGQFRTLLTYFSLPDVRRILLACGCTSVVSVVVWYGTGGRWAPPRSIILLNLFLGAAGIISARVAFRLIRERFAHRQAGVRVRRVGIIGAGYVGAHLAKDMQLRPGLRMRPVAFFDDDPRKWNVRIHGIPVVGSPAILEGGGTELDEVVIAMPSASGRRIRDLVSLLTKSGIKFESVPSMEQLMNGTVRVSQIRPVEIEDLLGRDAISLETERIAQLVKGRVVMVTGAGGSIGSELCRQIASFNPQRLLLVERCEVQIFQIEQELLARGHGSVIMPLVADVLDEHRMQGIFERFQPAVVFHAAAHKHVPMMEHQPYEAFRNNTLGTRLLARLAAEHGVRRFVMISTDKAINPTSVMGATKRLAELYLQALQKHSQTKTKFMAVRFGNVLGSSGSVIPTFKKQIAAGGPVTVTHPDVTRYFMTIPEAVGLVLQSATQGSGGEIFVLDMGRPIKIVDLARQLIELSGLRPDEDVAIEFVGLRPGEKLYEELNHDTENMAPTDHPKIMRFVGQPTGLEPLEEQFLELEDKSGVYEPEQLKLEIQRLIPEYQPHVAAV